MIRRLPIFAALVCLAVSNLRLSAQELIPAQRIVPKNTLVFARIPKVSELKNRIGDSVWMKMWNDPAMEQTRKDVLAAWAKLSEEFQTKTQLKLDELLAIPNGEVTLIVAPLADEQIGLAMMVQYAKEDAVVELLTALEKRLEDNDFDGTAEEIEKTPVSAWKKDEIQMGWFRKDGFLVAGSDLEILESLLVRWDGKHEDVLAEREEFRYIMNRCFSGSGEPAIAWFIDPVNLVTTLIQNPESGVKNAASLSFILPQLGVDGVKAAGGTMDLATEKFESVGESMVYVEGSLRGVAQMFRFTPSAQPAPDWARGDSEQFFSLNWDISGAWEAGRKIFDTFQGPGALDAIIDKLADHASGPRVHLKKDVIDNLNGRIQIEIAAEEKGAGDLLKSDAPRVVVALSLKNPNAMQDVLARVAKTEGIPIQVRTFQGTTIYEPPDTGRKISPAFCVAQGKLFISSNVQRLEEVLRGTEAEAQLKNSKVLTRLEQEAPEKVSIWGIERISQQLQRTLSQLKLVVSQLGGVQTGGFPDVSHLPDASFFEKYPLDRYYYIIPDERGVYLKDYILRYRQ